MTPQKSASHTLHLTPPSLPNHLPFSPKPNKLPLEGQFLPLHVGHSLIHVLVVNL